MIGHRVKPARWSWHPGRVVPAYRSIAHKIVDGRVWGFQTLRRLRLENNLGTREQGRYGWGWQSDASNERLSADALGFHKIVGFPITLVSFHHQLGTPANFPVFTGVSANQNDASPYWSYMLGGGPGGDPVYRLFTNHSGGVQTSLDSGRTISTDTGEEVVLIGQIAVDDQRIWVNGEQVASWTDALGDTPIYDTGGGSPASQWENGAQTGTTGRYHNARQYAQYILADVLTEKERWLLQVDPFGPARQDRVGRRFVSLPAAGPVVLTVADALHGLSSDAPALTQANTLVVADADHAHAADSPALTQANVLAVDDSDHGHTADEPALTQASTLGVNDADHAHSADSPALTQANTLAADDADHGHTADSPALTQANTLAANDADHGHTADEPTLSTGLTLAPEDADHDHAADSPALTQASTLVVEDADHGHTADEPTLSLADILDVDDAEHAHSADSPALTQAGTLTVDDADHALSSDAPALLQANTLTVEDALHGHVADSVVLVLIDNVFYRYLDSDALLIEEVAGDNMLIEEIADGGLL